MIIKQMKNYKDYLIFVLIVGLAFSIYLNVRSSKETEKEDGNIQTASFQNKQTCEQYRVGIEKRLKESYFYNPDTKYQLSYYLKKLFYSPKVNSCLYLEQEWGVLNGTLRDETFTLYDALTGEILKSSLLQLGSADYLIRKQAFENLVKEYE